MLALISHNQATPLSNASAVKQRPRRSIRRSSSGASALINKGRNSQAPNRVKTRLKCTKRNSTMPSIMGYSPILKP